MISYGSFKRFPGSLLYPFKSLFYRAITNTCNHRVLYRSPKIVALYLRICPGIFCPAVQVIIRNPRRSIFYSTANHIWRNNFCNFKVLLYPSGFVVRNINEIPAINHSVYNERSNFVHLRNRKIILTFINIPAFFKSRVSIQFSPQRKADITHNRRSLRKKAACTQQA